MTARVWTQVAAACLVLAIACVVFVGLGTPEHKSPAAVVAVALFVVQILSIHASYEAEKKGRP